MIIGLTKNNDEENLKVDEVATGLFVVRNAYAGDYDFFDSGEELFSNGKKETKPENSSRGDSKSNPSE